MATTLHRTGIVFAAVLIAAGASVLGPRAAQAFLPEDTSKPGFLMLRSEPAAMIFSDLSPGTVAYGHVEVHLDDAAIAELSLQAFAEGELFEHPTGMTLTAVMCDREWINIPDSEVTTGPAPECAGEERTVTSLNTPVALADSPASTPLGTITPNDPRFILIELRMPGTDAANDTTLMGLSGNFALRIAATGDDIAEPGTVIPSSPGATLLPATGTDALGVLLAAAGAIALGLLVRRHRRPNETE